jgi:hypothetical protein
LDIFFPSLGRRSPRIGFAFASSALNCPIRWQARRRISANLRWLSASSRTRA